MRLRKSYKDAEEKDSILAERAAAGNVLVEVQNHFDGDFLIFTDTPPAPTISIEARFAEIEVRLTELEKKGVL